jgi:hypothetical protein
MSRAPQWQRARPGQQVPAGGVGGGAPGRVVQQRDGGPVCVLRDDGRPVAGPVLLTAVHQDGGVARVAQRVPHRVRPPRATHRRGEPLRVPLRGDAAQAGPGQQQPVPVPDVRRLRRAQLAAAGRVADGATAAGRRGAHLGALQVGPLLPSGLALDLAAGHCTLDPGEQPAVVRGQVRVPADGGQRQPVPVRQVDEVLQLHRPAVEPVQVPRHDGAHPASGDVGQHPRVGGPNLAVAGAGVVVDVLHRLPAAFSAELQAVLALTGDGQARPVAVQGLAEIDGGSHVCKAIAIGNRITDLMHKWPRRCWNTDGARSPAPCD